MTQPRGTERVDVFPGGRFLRALVLDPFVELIVIPQIEAARALPGDSVTIFSKFAALIGKQLPGGFNVERETLSAELAARENLTLRGAHALMLRNAVNDRGIIGRIARSILREDLKFATEFDLIDVRRVLPNGVFKTEISRRLRELVRRRNAEARRRR